MNLYLVQHALAKAEDEDIERSLSSVGWSEIQRIGTFFSSKKNIDINLIMHSGKTRARQTAEVLSKYLNPPKGIKEVSGLFPGDDVTIWFNKLTDITENIMLVGHLPHLSKLAGCLLCSDENRKIIDFKNAGIVCLYRDDLGIWSVKWIVTPQLFD